MAKHFASTWQAALLCTVPISLICWNRMRDKSNHQSPAVWLISLSGPILYLHHVVVPSFLKQTYIKWLQPIFLLLLKMRTLLRLVHWKKTPLLQILKTRRRGRSEKQSVESDKEKINLQSSRSKNNGKACTVVKKKTSGRTRNSQG